VQLFYYLNLAGILLVPPFLGSLGKGDAARRAASMSLVVTTTQRCFLGFQLALCKEDFPLIFIVCIVTSWCGRSVALLLLEHSLRSQLCALSSLRDAPQRLVVEPPLSIAREALELRHTRLEQEKTSSTLVVDLQRMTLCITLGKHVMLVKHPAKKGCCFT
jgi:hypothetical protein